ncbi:MAG: signal peptidase I [Bacilli bacterium]
MKTIKSILHFLASVFMYSVLFLLLLIATTVIIYVVEQKQNIASGNPTAPIFSAYVIITNSMDPTIMVNDAIINRRSQPASIKVGDIITYVSDDAISYGKTITHRVVAKDQDDMGRYRFRTKGDNNNAEDPWIVLEKNVIGKAMFKIPMLGYIQQLLATAYGWIIAIVLPCLGIIIYDIIKLIKTLMLSNSKNKKPKKIDDMPNSMKTDGDDTELTSNGKGDIKHEEK